MLQEKTIILFINIGQVILQTPFNLIMFNTLFGCKYKNFFVTLQHMRGKNITFRTTTH
ncbi:hypothetical protein HMPREF1173_01650 [Prevotella nigrescens CC14M]|uniref:Uncharacterized protein n=1 Tax=Prevotella nigrescens CC14M TaxID=1073366 RepID=V8CM90_9BACT|nr:hypothetical protein HMPREF9419_0898 [Prevotella nigrescens ATCC 33563]ELX68468.1 hypothetical protein HMPREF0662_00219 [Prevotella nigrescens F0103]ETD28232.1 hypothetical protein HMPREF1173_01650 [Prevotella nigrescens CC14M]SUB92676.1 Uncharacterised protein [Prevotella nigrescens]